MPNRLTTEDFIERAKLSSLKDYDYSLVDYVNMRDKIVIKCPKHGEFKARPAMFLKGHGCTKCSNTYVPSTEEWVERAKSVHGDKYDYSLVEYNGSKTKVKIICNKHGVFDQEAKSHLNGSGCPSFPYGKLKFIEKAKLIHGDRYVYDKVNYVKHNKYVTIKCRIHGYFDQKPTLHLRGNNCSKCAHKERGKKSRSNTNDFIQKSFDIVGNVYTYEKVNYVSARQEVTITCDVHGDFVQKPEHHLRGQGCPSCVRKTEGKIYLDLIEMFPKIIREFSFPNLVSAKGNELRFDFACFNDQSNLICLVEYNGKQHYEPVKFFGGLSKFQQQQANDQNKRDFCNQRNIALIEIPYWDNDVRKHLEGLSNV